MLSGRHLIIGTLPDLPYVNYAKTQDGNLTKVEGFVPEIVEWLAENRKFTYEYVEPPDRAYGGLINGSWNGLIGLVSRGDIDVAGTDVSITYARSQVVDFTLAYAYDPAALLVPYPQLASTITGLIRPYKYEVWLGIVLSLFIVAFFVWLIKRIEAQVIFPNGEKYRGTFSDEAFFLFRVLANADGYFNNSPSIRILMAAWCLVALVIVQSYTSCLVSYLTAPKFIPFINSVEELANSNDKVMVVKKFTSFESVLKAATLGSLGKLGNKLRMYPDRVIDTMDNVEDLVANEQKVVVWTESVLKIMLSKDFKRTNQCRLALAKENLFSDRLAFALQKSTPMTAIFNYDLLVMEQAGLLRHWINSYLPNPNQCSAQLSSGPGAATHQLSLNFLLSAFLLYGAGVAIALVAFVHEIIISYLQFIFI